MGLTLPVMLVKKKLLNKYSWLYKVIVYYEVSCCTRLPVLDKMIESPIKKLYSPQPEAIVSMILENNACITKLSTDLKKFESTLDK